MTLAACGWHLQGSTRLPMAVTSIRLDTDDPYSDFYRALRDSLLASGAHLESQAASAVVHIRADKSGQRVASVSAKNKPEQYEVFYDVEYSVEVNGHEAIPLQQMELTASYSYDATAVLAKQREQISIQRALARELAGQVMRRLASVDGDVAR
jgi:LPS-assembly lipoprotein